MDFTLPTTIDKQTMKWLDKFTRNVFIGNSLKHGLRKNSSRYSKISWAQCTCASINSSILSISSHYALLVQYSNEKNESSHEKINMNGVKCAQLKLNKFLWTEVIFPFMQIWAWIIDMNTQAFQKTAADAFKVIFGSAVVWSALFHDASWNVIWKVLITASTYKKSGKKLDRTH